ncbi:MAG: hypothetical protein QXX68_00630 [Candidatus Pacearchaeota archaeon]
MKEKLMPKNVCFIDPSHIPEEFRAYHAGKAGQKLLVPINPLERGVFFALTQKQAEYFLRDLNDGQMYYADLRLLKDALYQKDYQSSVICRDRINDLDENEKERYIEDWYIKHTIPFNLNRISRIKTNRLGYLIVPAPIEVIF